MTREQMNELIDAHFRAEEKGDLVGTVATFTEDIVHDVVGRPENPLRGKEAVRRFYSNLFEDVILEKITSQQRYFGDDFAVDDSLVRARAVGSPQGVEGQNRIFHYRFLHVFEFRDGLISRENAWRDEVAIRNQLDAWRNEAQAESRV